MPGAKICHLALPALFFFLLFSPGGVEGTKASSSSRDPRALQGERRILLELLRDVRDSKASGIASSKKRLAGSRHAVFTRGLSKKDKQLRQLAESFVTRAYAVAKITQFFTDRSILPKECKKTFYQIYNTKECTTKALYEKCGRMIAKLSENPICF